MENILSVENLCKIFKGSAFQLDDVSFSVPYGSIIGLVGENGAGKTTIINCILNTIFKDNGKITLWGKEMCDSDAAMRENIGVVFDASNFSPTLTPNMLGKVMKDIYRQWDMAQYENYLKQFNLPKNQQLSKFSRGMTMKLAIATALSHAPKLLILDEATSGLDPIVRNEMLDIFLDFVQDETHSILLSSHIITDLEKIADYITFIHNGKVILNATKDVLRYQFGVLRCKASQFEQIEKAGMLAFCKQDYQVDILVTDKEKAQRKYKDMVVDDATIEEIMLLLVKGERLC